MNRVRRFFMTIWQPMLLYSVATAALILLLSYRLGSLPAHLSNDELSAVHASQTWQSLLHNPLYAPHKITLLVLQRAGLTGQAALRSATVGWAVLILLLFFS